MGCVSSHLLNHEDEFGTSALGVGHHIVSLTSTTYGLLNTLDPPTPPPSSRFTLKPLRSEPPEIINSWELMEGLDTESFRFSPLLPKPSNKENTDPNLNLNLALKKPGSALSDRFERICPPNGEKKVVIYTTTLRGVRRTFEACNAVRAAFDAFGVQICERDVSMDSGFKEELRELLKEKTVVPPRVFVKGYYIGGAEEMLKVVEEGLLGEVLQGLPRKAVGGGVCEGCGDMRFLPCFRCNGSCKMVSKQKQGNTVVVKCSDCNENGLVLCPLCS